MLAQTTTTLPVQIIVEQGTDPLTLIISVIAIVVASSVAIVTLLQGRTIKNIETREHKWEQQDRISAYVQVTRESFRRPSTVKVHGSTESAASFANVWFIRLTNTGRAKATDLTWDVCYAGDNDDFTVEAELGKILESPVSQLAVLHPGEHFDLPIKFGTVEGKETVSFTVSWKDKRDVPPEPTTRLINW